jgi:hypothetical protein
MRATKVGSPGIIPVRVGNLLRFDRTDKRVEDPPPPPPGIAQGPCLSPPATVTTVDAEAR